METFNIGVCIVTYNQEQYIGKCIESALSQISTQSYVIYIGEDRSTDHTLEICRKYALEYPSKIKLVENQTNLGLVSNTINLLRIMQADGCDYIAMLDGDDYWTNPLKLQSQVNFLDTHHEYGFVGTYNELLFPDKTIKYDSYEYLRNPKIEGNWELYGDVFNIAKYGPVTRTVSLCFRKEIIQPYLKFVGAGNDLVLQTILAKFSFFAKYSESMCMYRHGGVSTDKLNVQKQLYYNNWYVQNRLLQRKLFPEECHWDINELMDREVYIHMCDAIRHYHPQKALKYKKQLSSRLYQHKIFSRFLLGPLSCLILTLLYNLKKLN